MWYKKKRRIRVTDMDTNEINIGSSIAHRIVAFRHVHAIEHKISRNEHLLPKIMPIL